MNRTTAGRIMMRESLPEGMPMPDRPLTKKEAKNWYGLLGREYPQKYADTLLDLTDISRLAMDSEADRMSLTLDDFRLPPKSARYRAELMRKVKDAAGHPDWTEDRRDREVRNILTEGAEKLKKTVMEEAGRDGNAFARAIEWGIKGNPAQLLQMLAGDITAVDTSTGEVMPIPLTRSYTEGLTPMQAWASNYGGRSSLAAVKMATPTAGYFGKQLSLINHRQAVTGKDCGTDKGLVKSAADPETIGSVLSRSLGGLESGKVLGASELDELGDRDVMVRSAVTCEQPDGICQKCSGIREDGHFPPIGEYLGITVADTVSEPLSQTAIGSKHVGLAPGQDDDPEGFDLINNMFQMREGGFKGSSVTSPSDAKVKAVEKDKIGNKVIRLTTGETLKVPEGRKPLVGKGDAVKAGWPVTDGVPDPRDVIRHRGLGETRKVFLDAFRRTLENSGVNIRERNLEPTVRSFLNHVEITEPDTVEGHIPGDIVLYDRVQRQYRPREDSVQSSPDKALGKYLEQPVMHHTIGTPVTGDVVRDLEKQGIKQITTNDKPPGFRPHVVKLRTAMDADPDWKAQQAGWYLKKNFLENVRRGAESDYSDSSYVPFLMNPFDPRLEKNTAVSGDTA